MRDLDYYMLTILHKNNSITKTADYFYISQPTLTKRIHAIENELGVQLLFRNTKGVTFTASGERIVKYAQQITSLIDEMHRNLIISDHWDYRTVKIGISNSIIDYIVSGFLTDFTNRHPFLKIDLVNNYSSQTIDQIIQKHLDIGFITTDVFSSHISKYLIRHDPCFLVSSRPLSLSELPKMSRVYFSENANTTQILQNWWNERFSSPPQYSFKVPQGNDIIPLLANKNSYALLFYHGKSIVKNHNLIFQSLHFLDGSPVIRNSWMIYHRERNVDPLISNILSEISSCDFANF